MVRFLYDYFRKIKIFNKLFIIYATIMVVALLMLSAIVSYSLTSMVLKREIRYNQLILSSVRTHIEDSYAARTGKGTGSQADNVDKSGATVDKLPGDGIQPGQTADKLIVDREGLVKLIRDNYEMKYGSILIVTKDGDVLFDLSNEYYGKKYPIGDYKPGSSTYKINNKEYMIGVQKSSITGTFVVGVLPLDKVIGDMQGTKSTIFLITMFCILAAIFLTYFRKSEYQRRVQQITDAMKKVHEGDLSERIPESPSLDEISEITNGFNDMCDSLEKYIDKVYIADIKQKKAELEALQSKINPHFLYNTLEVIRMSAQTHGAEEAGEMIQILAKLFRNVVREDTIITIEDEIRNVRLYLELFKVRYGEALSYSFDIDEDILELSMIKHLMQPVIENYIIHGYDSRRTDNTIAIEGHRNGEHVVFTIQDNGIGMDKEMFDQLNAELLDKDFRKRDGIGLLNVNDRIRLIYDSDCGVGVQMLGNSENMNGDNDNDSGTIVRITIPAITREELEEHVKGIIS